MAKKSSTINVEDFVWKEIENIQKLQGITSRNTAIEYLVAEYRGLKNRTNDIGLSEDIQDNKTEEKKDENQSYEKLQKKLQDLEDSMSE